MKQKVFERKRRRKTRLRRIPAKRPSHFPETDDRANLIAGLDTLRRGSPQALTPDAIRALQRHVGNGALQRLAGEEGFVGDPSLEADLEREQGGGQPLATPVRGEMEGGFGADFGAVRVHTDGKADELSRDLGAYAFAYGRDIYFADGEYAPATTSGQQLLAHELAHVVQQGAGAKLVVGGAHDAAEREADRAADAVVRVIRSGETGLGRQVGPEEEGELWTVRRQEELEEEEDFIHTLRRQVEEEEQVPEDRISREELTAQLVRDGLLQLADALSEKMRATDTFAGILAVDLRDGVLPVLRGLEEVGFAPGAPALYEAGRENVRIVQQAWISAQQADYTDSLRVLPRRVRQFVETVDVAELRSDRYAALEERFWQSFGSLSADNAFHLEYNELLRDWNEALSSSQFYAGFPQLVSKFFLTPIGAAGAGGGEG